MPTERPVTRADVKEEIAEHRAVWLEVLGRQLASERRRHREELAAEIAKLEQRHQHQMHELKTVLRDLLASTDALERSFRLDGAGASVINLPERPPWMTRTNGLL